MSRLTEVAHAIIGGQRRLSSRLERLLPTWMQVDGNQDFISSVVPAYLSRDQTIYDIGGGKSPLVSRDVKSRHALRVIGIDISQEELDRAPVGTYDRKICADICSYRGPEDADLVICQALLEHVPDTENAIAAIAGTLKPGGSALLFLPSRSALFSRLNLLLPQRVKQWLLFSLFPETRGTQGFPAYYDRCTPAEFRKMAEAAGLIVDQQRVYFRSMYFSFFAPLHAFVRTCQMVAAKVAGENAAETFVICLRKPVRVMAAA